MEFNFKMISNEALAEQRIREASQKAMDSINVAAEALSSLEEWLLESGHERTLEYKEICKAYSSLVDAEAKLFGACGICVEGP